MKKVTKESASSALIFCKKMNAILAQKGNMRTYFENDGRAIPVTELLAGPCVVTALRSKDKNGYSALQIGFGTRKKNISKPISALFAKLGIKEVPKVIKEIRVENSDGFQIGQEIKVSDAFKEGDLISATGISKGKGFAGVVKRWHFKGGPKTHGQSDRQRAPGSIGSTTTPGRVFKGKRMAGRMGQAKFTVKNLKVVKVDSEKNTILVKGAVPGNKGSIVTLRK